MSHRAVTWLAWALWALSLIFAIFIVLLVLITPRVSEMGGLTLMSVFFAVVVLSYSTVGALVASRLPRNPVGWIFLVSAACFAMGEAANHNAVYGLVVVVGQDEVD